MPGIQHQLAVNPQPGSVVVENRKAVRATFEVEGARKTTGEVVGLDQWVWRTGVPFEVNGRLIPGDRRQAAEGLVVEVFCLPVRRVVLKDEGEVE
jgi:hypothetical protein